MVFGGNSEKLRQFKDFAQNHAVNYILADDPCARAWGALNLRHFVQQATLAVKKGLQDTFGSLKGTLASKVVESMAAALLERPDFLTIQDFARKYEHVVHLRVLSANRQHVRWKEFNLTPACFDDHSMESYVNKLFDAFDSSRPECHAFAIDLPSGIRADRDSKFRSSCSVNGRVVAVPSDAEKILVVDPASREAFAIDLPSGIRADRERKNWSSCSVNGRVVAVPCDAEKILVVDPASREAFAIDMPSGITADDRSWNFGSSCSVNGRVVAVPSEAEKILVVDPASREAFAIDMPSGITAHTKRKFSSSCSVNGRVVAVPRDAEKILVVDPASHEAFAIDLPSGITADDRSWKFESSCSVNGRVVAVPSEAEKILVVDPASREAFAIDLPSGITADGWKFASSCSVNGRVMAVPRDAEKILVVDPASREAFAIDLPSGITADRGDWKFVSSCSVNGRVVAVPSDAEKILVVDPTSREAFAIDLPPGITADRDWKFWSSCSVNGRVVAVPSDAEKILVVEVKASTSRPLSLDLHSSDVHQTAQFAELVAAVLSLWIYTDDPEPRQMAHATFEVHAVIQPGDLGRSVKIASVTADLPVGKVLFIVFKGTSYILDFLNWNLEHDHEITGEEGFFAHSGTVSTMRNTKFLKSDVFLNRLICAREQGLLRSQCAKGCFCWPLVGRHVCPNVLVLGMGRR
eukprot:s348_g27.t2